MYCGLHKPVPVSGESHHVPTEMARLREDCTARGCEKLSKLYRYLGSCLSFYCDIIPCFMYFSRGVGSENGGGSQFYCNHVSHIRSVRNIDNKQPQLAGRLSSRHKAVDSHKRPPKRVYHYLGPAQLISNRILTCPVHEPK